MTWFHVAIVRGDNSARNRRTDAVAAHAHLRLFNQRFASSPEFDPVVIGKALRPVQLARRQHPQPDVLDEVVHAVNDHQAEAVVRWNRVQGFHERLAIAFAAVVLHKKRAHFLAVLAPRRRAIQPDQIAGHQTVVIHRRHGSHRRAQIAANDAREMLGQKRGHPRVMPTRRYRAQWL